MIEHSAEYETDQFNMLSKCNLKPYDHAVEYLKLYGISVSFVDVPENPYWPDDSRSKFNFLIEFQEDQSGVSFSLYFSQSHREPLYYGRMEIDRANEERRRLRIENECPDLWAVLSCIIRDADCMDYDFEEWAENLGYDPDSRKAEKTYKACRQQTKEAMKIFNLDKIREYLEINELD